MHTSYGHCSLFLNPQQHNFSIQHDPHFISALQEIGLISKKINLQETDDRYFTGDNFLEHIAYMGCAPAIQFEADENSDAFSHIKIHYCKSAKLIYSKTHSRPPQCPNCKKPVANWQDKQSDTSIECDRCCTTARIDQFNWRKMAGYARLFIEITDIFPKEAIPQPALLDKLTAITGVKWLYFYSCQ